MTHPREHGIDEDAHGDEELQCQSRLRVLAPTGNGDEPRQLVVLHCLRPEGHGRLHRGLVEDHTEVWWRDSRDFGSDTGGPPGEEL